MNSCKNCSKLLKCVETLIEIGIFVCVCILCSLSSKDPFKSHRIGNITNYFLYENKDNLPDTECLCGETTMNRTCSEEEIYLGCKTVSFETIKFIRNSQRKLASSSFCGDMYASFVRNKGRKISDVFDLNYGVIRGLSISTMVVSLCLFLGNAIGYCLTKKTSSKKLIPLAIITILIWIARFVLSLVLFYYVENGDIQKYDDFLDCKNVRKSFFKRFSDVSKLRKCFLAFGIFSLISEIIGKVEQLCNPPEEDD